MAVRRIASVRNTILSPRNSIELTFAHTKVTRNTHRYEEVGAPAGVQQPINLYLRKTMIAGDDEDAPKLLKVTVEVVR